MSSRSPAAILFDVSGNLAVIQSGFPATGTVTGSAPGVMMAGSDGQFARLLKTATDGTLQVTGSLAATGSVGITNQVTVTTTGTLPVAVQGQVGVNNFPAVQNVSGTVNVGNWPPVVAVTGSQPTGSTHQGSPVVVGGVFTSGSYIKSLYVDVSGALYVTTSGSLPVTGGIQVLNQVAVSGAIHVTNQVINVTGSVAVTGSLAVDNVVRVTATGSLPVHLDSQVQVSNFPAVQAVSGAVNVYTQGPQLISGTVAVTGSVAVYTQGPQAVTGTVNLGNWPPVMAVSGSQLTGSTFAGSPVVIGGVSGSVVKAILTDDLGRIVTSPDGAAAVKGFSDGKIVLASTTITAIRATTYTEQSTDSQRSLVSTSANDAAAGTGARTVKITYYTAAMTGPFTETVTLNGTTPVNTVATDICYIEKMEVLTAGSTGSNVGVISLKAATGGGGVTVWSIAATDNRTFGAHHYVPQDKSAFITGFTAGIKGADTTGAIIRAVPIPTGSNAEVQISDLLRVPSSGQSNRAYGTPIEVSGSARITAYAVPDSTSSRTYYASFDFYEE